MILMYKYDCTSGYPIFLAYKPAFSSFFLVTMVIMKGQVIVLLYLLYAKIV